jgi:hypothetical protein
MEITSFPFGIPKDAETDYDFSSIETQIKMQDSYVTFREPLHYISIPSHKDSLIWDVEIMKEDGTVSILPSVNICKLSVYSLKAQEKKNILSPYTQSMKSILRGIGTNTSNIILIHSEDHMNSIVKSIQKLRDICLMYYEYSNSSSD